MANKSTRANKTTGANKAATGVIRANREQPIWDNVDPDTWLPQDDMARTVWAYVDQLDLHVLYDRIKARGSAPGRSAADPAILLALWLLATIDGTVRPAYNIQVAVTADHGLIPD